MTSKTQLKASAKDLLAALSFVAHAIARKPATPTLANVRINPGTGEIVAFDYEVKAHATLNESEGSGEVFLAPHRVLVDAVVSITRADKSAEVTITPGQGKDGEFVNVTACGYEIVIGCAPISEYPRVEVGAGTSSFSCEGTALKSLITRSLTAVARDETLPVLAGVRFEVADGALTSMATDRYRLAMNRMSINHDGKKVPSFLVKGKFLESVAKNLRATDCQVTVTDQWVRFDLPGGTLETLLVSGEFPKIRSLFPSDTPTAFAVDRLKLLEAVTVAARLAERNTPVVLKFDSEGVHASFSEGLFGASHAPVAPGHFVRGDENVVMAFNPRFVQGCLKALSGDQILIHVNSVSKPAMFTELDDVESSKHLIMIVRMPQEVAA